MGHERIGVLPKTTKWRELVDKISNLYSSETKVLDIANHTLKNVNKRFRNIHEDQGVLTAFKFLVTLSVAMNSKNPKSKLPTYDIELPKKATPLSVAKIVNKWIEEEKESLEYGEIAQKAVIDALVSWYHKKENEFQLSLFDEGDYSFEIWRKAGSGGGFCEIARLFFAKFTEHYLNYFLEREASGVLKNLEQRRRFKKEIENYTDDIAKHSLETAEIMKSFAAGWFNKQADNEVPPDKKIKGFMSFAFGKIRDELRRESEK